MASTALNLFIQVIGSCSAWFTSLLDSVGAGGLYIAFITIAFSISFLLSHFGSIFSLGSDNARRIAARSSTSESASMRKNGGDSRRSGGESDS